MQSQTDAVGANSGFDNGGAPSSVAEIIANVISTALSLLGIIFLGLIIFSGYGWMMAGGDEKVIETAKARMKNAVIGLIIVLAAYSITAFVFNNLNKTMGGGSGDIQGSGGGSGTTCNPACTGKTTCEQGDGGMACKP
jgi:hypothetical protein